MDELSQWNFSQITYQSRFADQSSNLLQNNDSLIIDSLAFLLLLEFFYVQSCKFISLHRQCHTEMSNMSGTDVSSQPIRSCHLIKLSTILRSLGMALLCHVFIFSGLNFFKVDIHTTNFILSCTNEHLNLSCNPANTIGNSAQLSACRI